MSQPLGALSAALQMAILASPVGALVQHRVADHLPMTPRYPCVRHTTRGRPIGTIADNRVWSCDAELDVFSTIAGWREAKAVAAALVTLLEPPAAVLVVAGWVVIVQTHTGVAEIPDAQAGDEVVKQLTVYGHFQLERAA